MPVLTEPKGGRKMKFSKIYEDLIRAIGKGKYKPFEFIPTEEALCADYSVSRTTAAAAINMLAEERIVKRVKGKGSFVLPSKNAVPEQKQTLLGVVVPAGASYNHTQVIVDNLLMQSEVHGFKPIVSRPYSSENAAQIVRHLSTTITAFLVYPAFQSPDFDDTVKKLRDKGTHIVMINFRLPGVETSYVVPDYEKAAYLATEYLINKGRKKIAYLTEARRYPFFNVKATNEHLAGYRKALADHRGKGGEIIIEDAVRETDPPEFFSHNVYVSYLAARELFSERNGISGLVTFNDMNAVGALVALRELGIGVPDDVSVVGFGDDSELHAYFEREKHGPCTLTTVSAHREMVALKAVDMISEMLAGEAEGTSRQVKIEPALIVRET